MLWLLPLLPILLAPVPALLAGRRSGGQGEGGRPQEVGPEEQRLRRRLAAVGLLATGGTAVLAAWATLASHGGAGWGGALRWSELITLRLALPPASAVMAVLVPAVAAPVVAFAALHEERRGLGRLVALLVAFVGAMELLVCAADLLTLLVGWELVGACSWALIGHQWWAEGKTRMANVAFVVTRAGDLGLFLAAGVAFAATGSFAYGGLAGMEGTPLALVVGGLLLAAASKSAQVPFSPWLFAAMAGPASVSALLHSATMVAAGAFLLVRLHPVLDGVPWFAPAAVAVGLATALAGGVVALLQPHAKKLLAGSTSAHHGLTFVAAGAGYPLVALLHLAVHALFKAPLFLLAGLAGSRVGGYRLADMKLGRVMPWAAGASAACALALAGLPPLGGAWTKEKVIAASGGLFRTADLQAAGGSAGLEVLLPWLVIVAGGLSAAYAARFHLQAFGRRETRPPGLAGHRARGGGGDGGAAPGETQPARRFRSTAGGTAQGAGPRRSGMIAPGADGSPGTRGRTRGSAGTADSPGIDGTVTGDRAGPRAEGRPGTPDRGGTGPRAGGEARQGGAGHGDGPEPARPGELSPIAVLAAATVAASLLWWPGAGKAVGEALAGAGPASVAGIAGEIPHGKAWELVASVALVLAGLGLGAWVARRRPRLGERGVAETLAAWLGLPALSRAALERPVLALARLAARFDDRILDAPPRLAGRLGHRLVAPALARFDDRVPDGIPRLASRVGRRLAAALAGGDRRVVDRGVELSAAFTGLLADFGSRVVEWVADRIPEGTGRWTGRAGGLTRRVQTGLSHHYYTLIVVGLALVLVLLFAAGVSGG